MNLSAMIRWTMFGLASLASWAGPATLAADDPTPDEIFRNRIMPIFRSPNPSSCVQCHLASVDLKDYILPSHEATFRSLRDQGLIDLDQPEASKILKLIEMGDQDPDENAKRIHQQMRSMELAAFQSWIVASAKDPKMRDLPPLEPGQRAAPEHPDPVIRHARKSRVVSSFSRHVWSQRMRCFPCHTPHEIKPDQLQARQTYEQWLEQYGEQMILFQATPEATLDHLVQRSQHTTAPHLPILNLENPLQSLLILKPASKVPPLIEGQRTPTYQTPVYHMGGLKIHKNDHSYKAFAQWIQDYGRTTAGAYQSVEELPADNWYPTQKILRLRDIPESWPVGTTVQMVVYRAGSDLLQTEPLGFSQGTVTPRRMVNGAMILLAPSSEQSFRRWQQQANRLPPGNYRVEIFVDSSDELAKDPTRMLGRDQYRGTLPLPKAQWQVGFPRATVVSASGLGSSADPPTDAPQAPKSRPAPENSGNKVGNQPTSLDRRK